MDALAELNEKFCADAKELRYILKMSDGKLVFSNDSRPHSPHVGSWLRSVKFKDENSYLFLLDIDSDYLSRKIIEGVKGLYETIYNYLHIKPLLKASGSKGAQLVFKLNFENDLTENECVDHMRDLAYTIWRLSTPSVREKIGFDEKPGIDCAVYKRRQMLRSFCIHLGSEKYSVPFKYHDSTGMIRRRMKLAAPLLDFDGFEELNFNEDYILYKYKKRRIYREARHFKTPDPKLRIKRTDKGKVYKRMPPLMQNIVDQEHTEHDLKWPVITYLHYFECMTDQEIGEWLFANTYWKDLSNVDVTNYHVGWSCNRTREAFNRNLKIEAEGERPLIYMVPLPKDIMLDIRTSQFGAEFDVSQELGWTIFRAYLAGIRKKFSEFLESEQYAK